MSAPRPGPQLTPAQAAAVAASGDVLVAAGAGSGKTTVLVERVVRALVERGVGPEQLLAITYTERAAGELVHRVRARLRELDRTDLVRQVEDAQVSTIHGFCNALLRRHALEAGIAPGFEVLDQLRASLLLEEALDAAIEGIGAAEPELLDTVAWCGLDAFRATVAAAFALVRGGDAGVLDAAGEDVEADLAEPLAAAAAAARALLELPPGGARLEEARVRATLVLDAVERRADAEELAASKHLLPHGGLAEGAELRAAIEALRTAASAVLEARLRVAVARARTALDAGYRARKRDLAALDFDDLQLETLRLLEERDDVREAVQGRYRVILVDEFQDTNALQCRLLDLVTGPDAERFVVGDAFQSIYRFRGADVEVFRRRRREVVAQPAGVALELRDSFRTRPEVLDVVNAVFQRAAGAADHAPLEAARPADGPALAHVELVLASGTAEEARGREAAALAARVRALVDDGVCGAGDVAVLLRSTTDAATYEAALREAGLATASSAGRGFFEAQEVRDVAAYLRLLRNRHDDVALLQVLASPLVGASADALALLRIAHPDAGGTDRQARFLITAVERPPDELASIDARRVRAFRQRYLRLVDAAPRLGLAELVERIVDDHDLDLALLARPDGPPALANLRKLARLAEAFEALRGPDLEGFAALVEKSRVEARESDASLAEEGVSAVRLLTIHAAKGLEFPVVVVADAARGRAGGRVAPVLLGADGRLQFRLPNADEQPPGYTAAAAADRAAEAAEVERLAYVALTRAADRLIVGGSSAASAGDGSILGALLTGLRPAATVPGDELALDVGGRPVRLVHVGVAEPADAGADEREAVARPAAEPLPAPGQLALDLDGVGGAEPLGDVPPPPPALPAPVPVAPSLSAAALGLHATCAYRFQAERLLGLVAPSGDDDGGLAARIGTLVHLVAQRGLDAADAAAAARDGGLDDEAAERVAALAGAWRAAPLRRETAALGTPLAEVPFALVLGARRVTGRLDLLVRGPDGALVVDLKTGAVGEDGPAAARDEAYLVQEAVYAAAVLAAGAPAVEVAFAFLAAGPDAVARRRFDAADLPALLAGLEERAEAALAGPWAPRPGRQCRGCPALGALCAGPDLERFHAAPDA